MDMETMREVEEMIDEQINEKAEVIVLIVKKIMKLVEENEEVLARFVDLVTRLTRRAYESYIREGFTEEQAFALVANLKATLGQNIKFKN